MLPMLRVQTLHPCRTVSSHWIDTRVSARDKECMWALQLAGGALMLARLLRVNSRRETDALRFSVVQESGPFALEELLAFPFDVAADAGDLIRVRPFASNDGIHRRAQIFAGDGSIVAEIATARTAFVQLSAIDQPHLCVE